MICQPLYQTVDHNAWAQRVTREHGIVQRFTKKSKYESQKPETRSNTNFWVKTAPQDSFVRKT